MTLERKPLSAPNRIASDAVMAGFKIAREAGIVKRVVEQANATRTDKRRWIVTLHSGERVTLTPSQAWAFLLGAMGTRGGKR